MPTLTIWLLISLGSVYGPTMTPTTTIARFGSAQECDRVRSTLVGEAGHQIPLLKCVQARVVAER